jgi:hypothetical protein
MALRPRDVLDSLQNKFGFAPDPHHESGHRWFVLRVAGLPPIRTKVSHGRSPIPTHVQSAMGRQLRVRAAFFQGMIACTKSRQDYLEALQTDPFPPFEHRIV